MLLPSEQRRYIGVRYLGDGQVDASFRNHVPRLDEWLLQHFEGDPTWPELAPRDNAGSTDCRELRSRCAHCAAPITLTVIDLDAHGNTTHQIWTCPQCLWANLGEFPGTLESVRSRRDNP
jgi:hypothetical protein